MGSTRDARNARTAKLATARIGVAASALAATVALTMVSTVPPAVQLAADKTALVMGGVTVPTPDEAYIDAVKNQFIAQTHPGQDIDYVAVTTPGELWPATGVARLIGWAVGDPRVWGPGGSGWPDEPWWKLSGLFDLTPNQSVNAGVTSLEAAMAAHGNDNLVIYGYSQSATIANIVKRRLAAKYPDETTAPDIDFVLGGDSNLPNGGLHARFPGLYIPILDWTFDGAELTDTPFTTFVITRKYDGLADFPLYPLNIIATLNALMGFVYLHTNPFDVALPADPTTSPAYQGASGTTSYYLFDTGNLPLFEPFRDLGVPEALIDVVEPFFRFLVELGYDRTIAPWEPTPARLIPLLDPRDVVVGLVDAIGECINNALALVGVPPPVRASAAVTSGFSTAQADTVDTSRQMTFAEETVDNADVPTETPTASENHTAPDTLTESVPKDDPPSSAQSTTDPDEPTPSPDVDEPMEPESEEADVDDEPIGTDQQPTATPAEQDASESAESPGGEDDVSSALRSQAISSPDRSDPPDPDT
ncbi:PE-PPE domain-containing protein [Mycolicibacterium pulveris]|uniref:PE-PPE domain-containing protein n=1 Tax=Mycolicibacterium pulveris TaxID=36813 RepID=UPI003CF1109D